MKKLMNEVDRFCARHPKFGVRNLMLYIVIANVAVWLFGMMDSGGTLISLLIFSPYHILRGQVWRIVSFALVPHNTGLLALISFYFYYFIGRTIEREWGSGKFTIYFFSGMVLTVVFGFAVYFIYGGGEALSYFIGGRLSAYYIYLSMFFTFATLYPDMQVLLFFILPIKMKWLGLLDLALFIYDVVRLWSVFPLNLLPVVAVLNYLLFCGGYLLDYLRRVRPADRAQRDNMVRFRSEVRRIKQEERERGYSRKCEVCGRTDADYPELEFRYCSRCRGYHCFCIDHINNHRHFTE